MFASQGFLSFRNILKMIDTVNKDTDLTDPNSLIGGNSFSLLFFFFCSFSHLLALWIALSQNIIPLPDPVNHASFKSKKSCFKSPFSVLSID